MSKKENYYFSISLFCLLLVLFAAQSLRAQNISSVTVRSTDDIESLRRQVEEQRSEIQKLRAELKDESELRKQQQRLLDTLSQKFEKLDSALAQGPKTGGEKSASVVPAVAEKTASPAATLAKTSDVGNQADAKKQPDKAPSVESGFGKIRLNGLLQGWYAAGDRGFTDTFRIRRAEMRLTGELMPKVRWSIMFDLAKALSLNNTSTNVSGILVLRDSSVNQSSRVFQEAFITLSHLKRANLQIGQFKLPVSQEGLQSSAALDTVERALFLTDRSRGGGLGDVRDTGVMAFGSLNKQVDYQIGVFNGSGENQNDVDRSDRKAIAGRLVFRPAVLKGLQFGGSGVWGRRATAENPRRDRLGAELLFGRGRFKFKSELMTGVDGDIHRRGGYAHFGYRFLPKLEGIFRFDTFDPNIRLETNAANATERDYITGINYFIRDNNLKLQINYLRKTFARELTPSRHLFLVNLQTSW